MKVLHVASFIGNIGDNANHSGLRACLSRHFGRTSYTELEIRYCYQIYRGPKRWQFDEDFVGLCNQHDLVIVGGGNFFEPRFSYSSTGTTIDLAPEVLARIKTPLVFFGVGFDTHKSSSDEALAKYARFVDQAISQPNVLLSFRNDGSWRNFTRAYPERAHLPIHTVPDGGFFFEADSSSVLPLMNGKRYWAINIAQDMLELRFPNDFSWGDFLHELCSVLQEQLIRDDDLHLLFVPHIFQDLSAISQLLGQMEDHYCRERVTVAPLLQGWEGARRIFPLYQAAELTLATRFHANVCPLAMGSRVLPLVTYPKLRDLYRELGMEDRCVQANHGGFAAELRSTLSTQLHESNSPALPAEQKGLIHKAMENFMGEVAKLL